DGSSGHPFHSYHRNYVAGRRLLLIRMAAPGTDVLPDASRFGAEASTTALKVVASAPGLQEDHMRFAPLLVALACGCATSSASGAVVLVTVQDASPGEHGVHIHEKGDCSDPAAMSAGAHFNPNQGAHHGGPNTPVRHGGDLGNINVNATGGGLLVVTVSDLSV